MGIVRGFFAGILCLLLFVILVALGLVTCLNLTVLNANFVTSELQKLDVYSTVIDQAKALVPSQPFLDSRTIDELATGLKPWFQEQAGTVIHAVYGYIKEGQSLNVDISLEPVRAAVKEKVAAAVTSSPPAILQSATQSQIDAYLSQIYAAIDNTIPASFLVNDSVAGSVLKIPLVSLRTVVTTIAAVYIYLIVAAVILVLLVALAQWWQQKPITRSTGITFIIVGVVCALGPLLNYLVVHFLGQGIGSVGLLTDLQPKLIQLVSDAMAPLRWYGIGFLAAGIMLVVVSFLFGSGERHSVETIA